MSDPRSVVPYHDPHNSPINLEYVDFMFDTPPTLDSIDEQPKKQQQQQEPTASFHQLSSQDNIIVDPNDPFRDPIIWDLWNKSGSHYYNNTKQSQEAAGPSTQKRPDAGDPHNVNVQSTCLGNAIPLTSWPPPLSPFQCTCCQVLREIIHTDGLTGNCTSKLEIHGRLGLICHAILEIKDNATEGSSKCSRFQMIDFCKKSIANVKEFLTQYCEEQKKAGYVLVQDPLSNFYEALCVGIDWDESINIDDFPDPSPPGNRQEHQMEGGNEAERVTKTSLAQQRERTGKLTLQDFVAYFHLPIEEAAKRMNLCPTVVKKICRREGMNRWPHRKIKSFQRQISNLRSLVDDAGERERALAEIERLEQKIEKLCDITTNKDQTT